MSKAWQGGMKYVIFIVLLFASKMVCGQMTDTIRPVQHEPDRTYMDSADHYIIYNNDVFISAEHIASLLPIRDSSVASFIFEYKKMILKRHQDMIDRENERIYNRDKDSSFLSLPPTDTLGQLIR